MSYARPNLPPILSMVMFAVPCLLAQQPSEAQTITYVAQERWVEAVAHDEIDPGEPDEQIFHGRERLAAEDFGPFDAVASVTHLGDAGSSISQHSRLGGDGVTASGGWSGSTGSLYGYWRFETSLATAFEVADAPALYSLDFHADFVPGLEAADLSLRRLDAGGATVFDWGPADKQEASTRAWEDAHLAGRLDPGRYEFHFLYRAEHDVHERGDYGLSLRLAPVPEPSSAAILALGSAAALLPRRRRRCRAG